MRLCGAPFAPTPPAAVCGSESNACVSLRAGSRRRAYRQQSEMSYLGRLLLHEHTKGANGFTTDDEHTITVVSAVASALSMLGSGGIIWAILWFGKVHTIPFYQTA